MKYLHIIGFPFLFLMLVGCVFDPWEVYEFINTDTNTFSISDTFSEELPDRILFNKYYAGNILIDIYLKMYKHEKIEYSIVNYSYENDSIIINEVRMYKDNSEFKILSTSLININLEISKKNPIYYIGGYSSPYTKGLKLEDNEEIKVEVDATVFEAGVEKNYTIVYNFRVKKNWGLFRLIVTA